MTGGNGGCQWLVVVVWGDSSLLLQWVAVVGDAGEKFSKIFCYQNELKSLKKQHVFLLFFSIKGGGWVGGSDP